MKNKTKQRIGCFFLLFVLLILILLGAGLLHHSGPLFNEKTTFEKTIGEIHADPHSTFVFSFYFESDVWMKEEELTKEAQKLKIAVNGSAARIVDYRITPGDRKTKRYDFALYLDIDQEMDFVLDTIMIGEHSYDIGPILIHSIENSDDFEVVRAYAIGKTFTKYEAALKNISSRPLTITSIHCGEFASSMQSGSIRIGDISYDIDSMNEKTIEAGQEVSISIDLIQKSIPSDCKVVFLSPQIEYEMDGELKQSYLPYCVYNMLM